MTREQELKVRQIIANMGSGSADVEPYSTLGDLGFDSLDALELDVKLASEFALPFDWPEPEFTPSTTVRQIQDAVAAALPQQSEGQ